MYLYANIHTYLYNQVNDSFYVLKMYAHTYVVHKIGCVLLCAQFVLLLLNVTFVKSVCELVQTMLLPTCILEYLPQHRNQQMVTLTWNRCAQRIGVSSEALQANADGIVVLDPAVCILSARSWAWVDALLSHTGLVAGTVGVDHTLGPTVGRCTQVFRQAGAGRAAVQLSAL